MGLMIQAKFHLANQERDAWIPGVITNSQSSRMTALFTDGEFVHIPKSVLRLWKPPANSLSQCEVGMTVVVKFDGKCWYRGRVNAKSSSSTAVTIFFDDGDVSIVPGEECYAVPGGLQLPGRLSAAERRRAPPSSPAAAIELAGSRDRTPSSPAAAIELADSRDRALTLRGINIQQPWARLILEGKKRLEARAYALAPSSVYRNEPLWLIETPGKCERSARFAARIIGAVCFDTSKEYATTAEWRADEVGGHLINEVHKARAAPGQPSPPRVLALSANRCVRRRAGIAVRLARGERTDARVEGRVGSCASRGCSRTSEGRARLRAVPTRRRALRGRRRRAVTDDIALPYVPRIMTLISQ